MLSLILASASPLVVSTPSDTCAASPFLMPLSTTTLSFSPHSLLLVFSLCSSSVFLQATNFETRANILSAVLQVARSTSHTTSDSNEMPLVTTHCTRHAPLAHVLRDICTRERLTWKRPVCCHRRCRCPPHRPSLPSLPFLPPCISNQKEKHYQLLQVAVYNHLIPNAAKQHPLNLLSPLQLNTLLISIPQTGTTPHLLPSSHARLL